MWMLTQKREVKGPQVGDISVYAKLARVVVEEDGVSA
jgi:hypothetical protein